MNEGDLLGILTHAGEIRVDDEDVCGLFITCDRQTLAAAKTLPMYEHVRVRETTRHGAESTERGWRPAATAPKTRVILADTGYPWPLPCMWDAEAGKWAVATLNVEAQNAAKESQNVWWETDYECAITAWAEMPAMPNSKLTGAA